jgi:hypothetical protein
MLQEPEAAGSAAAAVDKSSALASNPPLTFIPKHNQKHLPAAKRIRKVNHSFPSPRTSYSSRKSIGLFPTVKLGALEQPLSIAKISPERIEQIIILSPSAILVSIWNTTLTISLINPCARAHGAALSSGRCEPKFSPTEETRRGAMKSQ